MDFCEHKKRIITNRQRFQIKLVQYVLEFVTTILTHIYNIILQASVFPNKGKRERAAVIIRTGAEKAEKIDASIYKPVSSKCIKKLFFQLLPNYLKVKISLRRHNSVSGKEGLLKKPYYLLKSTYCQVRKAISLPTHLVIISLKPSTDSTIYSS